MERENKKILILSVAICLLPIILGGILYNKLPDKMPIHFTISNEPDSYAPKNLALFGLPIIMAVVQAISIIFTSKVAKQENNKKPKIIKIMEWFIPIVTVLLYIIMIEVPLRSTVYVGKSVVLILGILFIITGNYLPKMSYEIGKTFFHPIPKNEKSFRKIIKIMGCSFIMLGIIMLILMIWV